MHTILEFTNAQEARAVARAWLARSRAAACEARPWQLLEFVLPLASAGQREAEAARMKVHQAHPAACHRAWTLRTARGRPTTTTWGVHRGRAGAQQAALARQAADAAAGQGPLFPMSRN